ncbi:MAG: zeta toxin family protein [Propionibacteriaceae bacterium]|jgi:hypothetical protein|nr:zeta toxin family protein [Propionibacteriaceae bacterium]
MEFVYDVAEARLEEIWQTAIRPDVFAAAAAHPQPVLVLVGAQPGSGKTRAVGAARRRHPDQAFVRLDTDDMRRYHPDFAQLALEPDPLAMPEATAEAAGWWTRRSIRHAIESRYPVILEGTFRRLSVPSGSARDFAAAGYTVEVLALGVAEKISWAGCVARYLNALANPDPEDVPRWAPVEIHDAAFRSMPGVAQTLADSDDVERAVVTDRDGVVHHDSAAAANPLADVAAAINELRAHPGSAALDILASDLARIRRQAAHLPLADVVLEGLRHLEDLAAAVDQA